MNRSKPVVQVRRSDVTATLTYQIVVVPCVLSLIGFGFAGEDPAWTAICLTLAVAFVGVLIAFAVLRRSKRYATSVLRSGGLVEKSSPAGLVVIASAYPSDQGRDTVLGPVRRLTEDDQAITRWQDSSSGRAAQWFACKRVAVLGSRSPLSMGDDIRDWLLHEGKEVRNFTFEADEETSTAAIHRTSLNAIDWVAEPSGAAGNVVVDVTGGTKVMGLGAFEAARGRGARVVYQQTIYGDTKKVHVRELLAPEEDT